MSPLVNWEFYFDPSQATIQIESEEKILLVCGEQIQNTFIQNLSTRNVQSNIEYEWNWTQWQWANAEWCLCLPASPIHIYTWLFAHSNIMTVTHHEWVRRVLVKHNSIFEFQLKSNSTQKSLNGRFSWSFWNGFAHFSTDGVRKLAWVSFNLTHWIY